MEKNPPVPRRFYEERYTGNLYYGIGQARYLPGSKEEEYIFETRNGRKTIPLSQFQVAMTRVNPLINPNFQFKHLGCRELFERVTSSSKREKIRKLCS